MDSIPQKRCTACLQVFPATLEYFHLDKRVPSGLRAKCKTCRNEGRTSPPKPPRYQDGLKRCIACGEHRPATREYFYADKKRPDGLKDRCKKCRKTANPIKPSSDAVKQCRRCKSEYPATSEYFALSPENRDGMNGICRKCKKGDDKVRRQTDKRRVYQRNYYPQWTQETREQRREYARQYRESHREKARQHNRKHTKTHLAQKNAAWHRRNAKKHKIGGAYTPEQIQEQLKHQKHMCYYCSAKFEKKAGKYVYHIDHTFPINRVTGTGIPANDISYLVLACPFCNLSKGDKFPWEFPEGGRLL